MADFRCFDRYTKNNRYKQKNNQARQRLGPRFKRRKPARGGGRDTCLVPLASFVGYTLRLISGRFVLFASLPCGEPLGDRLSSGDNDDVLLAPGEMGEGGVLCRLEKN